MTSEQPEQGGHTPEQRAMLAHIRELMAERDALREENERLAEAGTAHEGLIHVSQDEYNALAQKLAAAEEALKMSGEEWLYEPMTAPEWHQPDCVRLAGHRYISQVGRPMLTADTSKCSPSCAAARDILFPAAALTPSEKGDSNG